jgi:DNA-binding CsgD family transcriptional regulator
MNTSEATHGRTLLEEIIRGKSLSAAEERVLLRAAFGDRAGDTAELLNYSVETVKGYRKTSIAKLGARNLTHAV